MPLADFAPAVPTRITSPEYIAKAREDFLRRRPAALDRLLRGRYEWMNAHLAGRPRVIELGAGMGLSREYLRHPGLEITDLSPYPWIDRSLDAASLELPDGSVDAFILCQVLHHLPSPVSFFERAALALKPGGLLLIQELEVSILLRLLQRIMRHEGWSLSVDAFDPHASCIPGDGGPWAANTAIGRLLFDSSAEFERRVPRFRVVENELCEALAFPLSGGVLAKAPMPPLPETAVRAVERLDRWLVRLAPRVFAMGRRVVLEKR